MTYIMPFSSLNNFGLIIGLFAYYDVKVFSAISFAKSLPSDGGCSGCATRAVNCPECSMFQSSHVETES